MFWESKDFWPYWPDHGLIVVDMQKLLVTWRVPEIQGYLNKLVTKICAHISMCLELWGEVVVVEFTSELLGDTLPIVLETAWIWHAKRSNWNSVFLQKKRANLLDEKNVSAMHHFQQRKNNNSKQKYTVWWVNISKCVIETALWVSKIFDTRIHAGLAMDPRSIEWNMLSRLNILVHYSWLLYVPEMKDDCHSLTDFL